MKKLTITLSIVAACAIASCSSTSTSPTPSGSHFPVSVGGTGQEEGLSVVQTDDGGYAAFGTTTSFGNGGTDFYLVRTNANGDTLWTKTYGGKKDDEGYSMQKTSDGGFIMVGHTLSFGNGFYDIYLVRTNANGDTLWTKTFGGPNDDRAYSVRLTSDGGYVIAGSTTSKGAGSSDFYIVKTDANGNMLWDQTLGGTSADVASDVEQTKDGGYIVIGRPASAISQVATARLDQQGKKIVDLTPIIGVPLQAYTVHQTPDGGFICAGFSHLAGDIIDSLCLIKLDTSAKRMIWERNYSTPHGCRGSSMQVTADSGYIALGYTNVTITANTDFYLVKTDANGNLQWSNTYGGASDDVGRSVQQTRDGGYIMLGSTTVSSETDMHLIKVDAQGQK